MDAERANKREPQQNSDMGGLLRDFRKKRGMTLVEVGEKSGMPMSTISKIENNKISLSYSKLLRICNALDIDVAELFSGASNAGNMSFPTTSGRRSINPRGSGVAVDTRNYSRLYPAADLLNKRISPVIMDIHVRSIEEFGELIRHPGEEFTVVLEGAVDMYTELYAPTRLETGDSIYFDGEMAHAYIAVSEGTCRVLSVCTADEPEPKLRSVKLLKE